MKGKSTQKEQKNVLSLVYDLNPFDSYYSQKENKINCEVKMEESSEGTQKIKLFNEFSKAYEALKHLYKSGKLTMYIDEEEKPLVPELVSSKDGLIFVKLETEYIKEIKTLHNLFKNVVHLKEIDSSDFPLSNITDLSYAFEGCSNLVKININNWKVDKVTTFEGMFSHCEKLTEFDLHGWDVRKSKNFKMMFKNCLNSSHINLFNWKIKDLSNSDGMFEGVEGTLDISDWNEQNLNIVRKSIKEASIIHLTPDKYHPGVYLVQDGTKFIGDPSKGFSEGFGKFIFNNGDKCFSQFINGKITGVGRYFFKNNDEFFGQLQNGKFHGIGTYYFSSGNKYFGQFKNGSIEGFGEITSPDGKKNIGDFKNGSLDGFGIKKNGEYYEEGEYKGNKLKGYGVIHQRGLNSQIHIENDSNGKEIEYGLYDFYNLGVKVEAKFVEDDSDDEEDSRNYFKMDVGVINFPDGCYENISNVVMRKDDFYSLRKLTIGKFNLVDMDETSINTSCPICLSKFKLGDDIFIFPCHTLHLKCGFSSLIYKKECPLCRSTKLEM